MRVDVTNCDDCPFFKQGDMGEWCDAPKGCASASDADCCEAVSTNTIPPSCPLLNGDITIGVMGDGDE